MDPEVRREARALVQTSAHISIESLALVREALRATDLQWQADQNTVLCRAILGCPGDIPAPSLEIPRGVRGI